MLNFATSPNCVARLGDSARFGHQRRPPLGRHPPLAKSAGDLFVILCAGEGFRRFKFIGATQDLQIGLGY